MPSTLMRKMTDEMVAIHAAAALVAVFRDDYARAERLMAKVPRSRRGEVRMAADDLNLLVERLGRRVDE
jgi:hypothetical protein